MKYLSVSISLNRQTIYITVRYNIKLCINIKYLKKFSKLD